MAGSALFGLWGIGCYLVLLILRADPIQLQLAGHPPPDVALAFAAFGVAQTGRIEAAHRTVMSGTPQFGGERESYYAKGLRWLQALVYRRLVGSMADNEARLLVRRGLAVAYDVHAMMAEYRTWVLNHSDQARAHVLLDWSKSVYNSKLRTEAQKLDMLIQSLIHDDLEMAKALAKRRAPAIIYRRAL